jgi:hypothetical protein
VVFPSRIEGVFHVKSRVSLRFDYFTSRRFAPSFITTNPTYSCLVRYETTPICDRYQLERIRLKAIICYVDLKRKEVDAILKTALNIVNILNQMKFTYHKYIFILTNISQHKPPIKCI